MGARHLPELPESAEGRLIVARSWLTAEAEKVRERTRYQQAGDLHREGLSVPAIALQMEIKSSSAAKLIEYNRSKEQIAGALPEVGVTELAERMARVYPQGDERRDWIRVQMAEWERQHKERQR